MDYVGAADHVHVDISPIEQAVRDFQMEVVINACYGGYGFSDAFKQAFAIRYPHKADIIERSSFRVSVRSDPDVISLLHEMGLAASSAPYAKLMLYKVCPKLLPLVRIQEYDGREWIDIDYNAGYRTILENVITMPNLSDAQMEDVRQQYQELSSLSKEQETLN